MAHGIAVSTPSHSPTDHPWSSSREEVANAYQTDLVAGLTTEKADRNLERFGLNQLETSQQVTWTRMLFAQFANTMVALLLAAAVISGVIGEWTDAVLIGLIVIANAVLGFTQEWTAARAIESLQRMSEPNARVCRNGVWKRIPVAHVTQGDLIEIIAGEIIPADARLIEVTQLEVSEAPLTGESNPIEKSLDAVSDPAPVPDRICMVYAGTSVVAGRGRAVVTAIGMKTEIGHIAELLAETTHAATPLQQRLDRLTRHLTIAIVAAAVVVFALGFRRHGVAQMLLTSVGLAVAALPEGLPAVITISLAIGAKRMAARKAIIRRLTSVETLGSVKVVCTDKTGTLTQNLMTVTQIVPSHDGVNSSQDLLQAAVLCNDAGSDSDGNLKGSPTEKAFLLIAQDHKIDVGEIRQRFERVAEVPFSSTRKRMITVHRTEQGGHVVFVKGAIEVVLPLCARVAGQEGPVPIDEIHAAATRFAKRGHRVLVFARRYWDANQSRPDEDDWGHDLEYLGFAALSDPVRPEAPDAIRQCLSAGIKPVLITGDHPETARSIAEDLGILKQGDSVLNGAFLDELTDDQLREHVGRTSVYARVSPEHKLRIVRCHQAEGVVTAMTGDGVNDAPALQRADIGVAMGLNGTDVAKGASAMILADDNFATIVAAVEEGRTVFDNIRKSLAYLFSGNIAEVLLLFSAVLLGLPLPLFPIQILWINLVTDGLPALAMAFEPPESNVMRRSPRPRSEGLFAGGLLWGVLSVGISVSAALLLLFHGMLPTDVSDAQRIVYGQTSVFMTLGLVELMFAISARDLSGRASLSGLLRNRSLAISVTLGAILQLLVCYVPFLQSIFHTTSLSVRDFAICLGVSLTGFAVFESWKALRTKGVSHDIQDKSVEQHGQSSP